MPSNDLGFQQLSTVQGTFAPKPPTIVSAASIAPATFLSFVSGTVAIATITPPEDGAHMLAFIFTTTTPVAFTTTGNIKAISTPAQNVPVLAIFNPVDAKYYVGVLKAS
jgi:hypothetical protein